MKNGKRERRRKQANLAPSSFVLGQKIGPYRARDRRLSRPHGLFRGRIVWEEECVWSWPQNVPLVTFCSCDQTPWREKRHSDTKIWLLLLFPNQDIGFCISVHQEKKVLLLAFNINMELHGRNAVEKLIEAMRNIIKDCSLRPSSVHQEWDILLIWYSVWK